MKKIISSVLVFAMLSLNLFAQTRYEKIADKTYNAIYSNQKSLAKENSSTTKKGLTTKQKVVAVAGGLLVFGGGYLLHELFESKYEKVAEKAATSFGRSIANALARGILGSLLKK